MKEEIFFSAVTALMACSLAAPAGANGTPTAQWFEKSPLLIKEPGSNALPGATPYQGVIPPGSGPMMDGNSLLLIRTPGKRE